MELRPGYAQSELGKVPADWQLAPVARMGEVITGKALTAQAPGLQRPYLRTKNVFDGRIDITDVLTMPMTDAQFDQFMVESGDVLLNEGQSIELVGRCAIYRNEFPEPCAIQNQLLRFRARSECSSEFATHLFRFAQQSGVFARIALQTTSIAHLGGKRFENLVLPWPPTRDDQEAIAAALNDIDALMHGLVRLINKKRDLQQGAMQRLLTGQTRLAGFTAPWQERRLGDHVTFLKNGIQSRAQLTLDDPVRYLHYGDIHVSADLSLDLRKTAMPRLPSLAAAGLTRLKDGDLVFVDASEDLNGVGKSLEIMGTDGIEAVSGQHTIAARFDKSVLADGYKCYLQFMPSFTMHLRRLAAGTKVYATNRKHISSAELRLPEPDEQIAIAGVLSDMEIENSTLETRLDKTRALKQAMMQALLTGRVRLPVRLDAAPQTKEAAHA